MVLNRTGLWWLLFTSCKTLCVIAKKACSPDSASKTYYTNAALWYLATSRVFLPDSADNARFRLMYWLGITHDSVLDFLMKGGEIP